MAALLAFSRAIDSLNERIGKFAAWLVLLACLVSAGNAMVRYGIGTSGNAWLEIQWYLFSAVFLLGASYTLKMNEHVRVDIVYSAISGRARLWIDLLGTLIFLLPAVIMLTLMMLPFFANSVMKPPTVPGFATTLEGIFNRAGWEESDKAGGLIRWPVKILMPIGFFLLSLQGLSELIKRAAALVGAYRLDTRYERPLQ